MEVSTPFNLIIMAAMLALWVACAGQDAVPTPPLGSPEWQQVQEKLAGNTFEIKQEVRSSL